MIQELLLQNLAEKLIPSCIQYGWDLNSGAWLLFQSNIKRDLHILKSHFGLVWATSIQWKYLSADPDGGVSRYRYVSVRALQPLE